MTLPSIVTKGASPLIAALGLALNAQVVVITSARNPISKVTPDQLVQIFMGQVSTFYSGGRAEPLDLEASSPLREEFYQKFLGKSQSQLKAYWSKQAFSGKGQPPRALPSSQDLVRLVAENPKYIAYVEPGAVDSNVKILKIQ